MRLKNSSQRKVKLERVPKKKTNSLKKYKKKNNHLELHQIKLNSNRDKNKRNNLK